MPNSKSPDQALALITTVATEVATELGFVLVDAHFGQQGRKTALEISIHKPHGRVGLSDCEKVSRALDERLEAMSELPALLHGAYVLDVCSPGLERVLKHQREYDIFKGSLVEVKVKSDVGAGSFGQHFIATLEGFDGKSEAITLAHLKELPKAGGAKNKSKSKHGKMPAPEPVNQLSVPLKQISQIKLYVDMSKIAEVEKDGENLDDTDIVDLNSICDDDQQ